MQQKHGTEEQVNRMSTSKCDFCRFRHSWDCDDGLPYPENGCKDFTLDKTHYQIKNRECWFCLRF